MGGVCRDGIASTFVCGLNGGVGGLGGHTARAACGGGGGVGIDDAENSWVVFIAVAFAT